MIIPKCSSANFTKLQQIWSEEWVKILKSKCQADPDVSRSEAGILAKGAFTQAQWF